MMMFDTLTDFFFSPLFLIRIPDEGKQLTVILAVCFSFSLPCKDTRGLFKNMSTMIFNSVWGIGFLLMFVYF